MLLKDARTLQVEIKNRDYHCVVPLGNGPDDYFCRIFRGENGQLIPIDFHDRASFRKYHAAALWRRRKIMRDWNKEQLRQRLVRQRRSPLDTMIDRACGLE